MKIIILAAGIGSRLGKPYPKTLTKLKDGKTILEHQINSLSKAFSFEDIHIVVGFKKDLIMEAFPDTGYIYNQYYKKTNTSKSLLKAIKKFRSSSILWLNGDVVFEPQIPGHLKKWTDKNISFVAVNKTKCGEEEIKYTLDSDKKYIKDISKIVKNGLGEALGINFISSDNINTFIKWLEECDNDDYFEKGIELAIEKDNMKVIPLDISEFKCVEVDFKEDLINANKLV
ncbi:NTP transferase domain-containing protein [Bacteroidota bacterium]